MQPHCWRMPEAASGQELEPSFSPPTTTILCIWICDEPKPQRFLVQVCLFIGKWKCSYMHSTCKCLGIPCTLWKDPLLLQQVSLQVRETIIKTLILILISLFSPCISELLAYRFSSFHLKALNKVPLVALYLRNLVAFLTCKPSLQRYLR